MIGVDGGEEDRPYPAVGERAGDEIILHGTAVRAGWQVARVDELKQALVTPEHRVGDVQVDHVPVHVAGLNLRPDLGQAAIVVLQAHLDPGGGGERHVVRLLAGPCVGSRRRKPRSAPDPPQAAHSGSVPQAAQRHSQAIGRYAVGSISCAHHLVATPHVQVSLCVNCRQGTISASLRCYDWSPPKTMTGDRMRRPRARASGAPAEASRVCPGPDSHN